MSHQPYMAVIGAGYWGKNLVRNFYELGVLKIICDQQSKIQVSSQGTYPEVEFTANSQEVFDDPGIYGVVIATPAETHFTLARKALQAGKHVFVEKPLALLTTEGEQLIALAREKQKVLMVGHILQYHPAVMKLKELIDRGELGKIQYIYSNRLNMGKIRSEENILWSFAPHDISVILMLLNEFPETIQATGGEYLQKDIADVTLTSMSFPSGVQSHIFVSWLHPFKEQKLVVIGDRQMAVFDDVSQEKLFLYPHTIEWKGRIPVANKAEVKIVPFDQQEPLRAECQQFLQSIHEGITPKTDGQEGLRVLKVLQACQESLNSFGKSISLTQSIFHSTQDKEGFFAHSTVEIDPGCRIGKGTKIWHFSHILQGSTIGKNCRIGQNVVIGPRCRIGNGCKIQNNVSVYEGVTLEDEVFCGPSMVFTNVFNPRAAIPRMNELRPTLVKKGATIGANATIICGYTIGSYAFVGAGAVVTRDLPDHALAVGNPARIVGWVCSCGIKIQFEEDKGECPICKRKFLNHHTHIKLLN
ncbi:MAG: Gfo/Idh/MocA family oxidoreductase [bacterium]